MLSGWLKGSIVKLERSTRPRQLFRHARVEWREHKHCDLFRKIGDPLQSVAKGKDKYVEGSGAAQKWNERLVAGEKIVRSTVTEDFGNENKH